MKFFGGYYLSLLFSLCFVLSSCGESLLKNKIEAHAQARFLVQASDLTKAADLGLTIEGAHGQDFLAFGPSGSLDSIRRDLPNSVLQTANVADELQDFLQNHSEIEAKLYNWDKVVQDLNAWSATHAQNIQLLKYGTSTQGRDLLGMRLSETDSQHGLSEKPVVMITGATHGNEILTVDTVMGIAKNLIKNLDQKRIADLLKKMDVVFVPVVSPDSYVARQRHVDGVDPNRDFPWPESTEHRSTNVIDAVSRFALGFNLVASIDYHSVGSVIMWPWAYTADAPAEAARYRDVAQRMAQVNQFRIGQISKVMYVAKGSSADFYLWKTGSMSFGIELSQSMPTSPNTPDDMVRENLESTIRFLEASVAGE